MLFEKNILIEEFLIDHTWKACRKFGLSEVDTDYVVSETRAAARDGSIKDAASFSYALIDAIRNRDGK